MNKIQETFLRVCLKPAVTSNLPRPALTVLPIWVITYIFLPKVYRIYKLRNEKKEDK